MTWQLCRKRVLMAWSFAMAGCHRQVVFLLLVSLALVSTTLSPNSYLTVSDKVRLRRVFEASLSQRDLTGLHYGVKGMNLLKEPIPNNNDICSFLKSRLEGSPSVDALYYISTTAKALPACSIKTTTNAEKILNAAITEEASVTELYQATLGLLDFGLKPDSAKISKALQVALRKDDSLQSFGLSFHLASRLPGDPTPFYDRIEDAVVQADEVDGKMLQFEGGLSLTGLVVSGAYRLATAAKKPPPITSDQALKFANYFLSRRSVQVVKGAFHLLDVIFLLADNKFHRPVAVTMAGPPSIWEQQPKVSIRVTDLLGQSLGPLAVTADSATRASDGAVVLSKKKFQAISSDSSLYELDLMEAKPSAGFYKLLVTAVPNQPDGRIIGNTGVQVEVKVLAKVTVEAAEVGVVDADQATATRLTKVAFNSKLGEVLEADHQQRLLVRVTLKATGLVDDNQPMRAHQVFLRLEHVNSGQEIIFVAEPDNIGLYRFDLDMGSKAKEFSSLSGQYSAHLVVGDAVIANPFSWHFADLMLKFPEQPVMTKRSNEMYQPKPEIKHVFRARDKRPKAVVSNTFTALVLAPVLLLFILWARLGINISNFPFSISAIGFHLGLGAILSLFGVFWFKLNMFTTLKCLTAIGAVTFLCGNKMLARIARERKQ